MAIPAILFREEPDERRGEERWRVRFGARRLDSNPAAQPLTILDLSSSGILLETEHSLGIDSCLIVEMPGDVTKICKTAWNSGRFYGATFSDPLSDVELRKLISSSCVAWPNFGVGTPPPSIGSLIQTSSNNFDEFRLDKGEKFPVAVRLMIFIGTSVALWALIGLGILLALR